MLIAKEPFEARVERDASSLFRGEAEEGICLDTREARVGYCGGSSAGMRRLRVADRRDGLMRGVDEVAVEPGGLRPRLEEDAMLVFP